MRSGIEGQTAVSIIERKNWICCRWEIDYWLLIDHIKRQLENLRNKFILDVFEKKP